MKVGIFGSGQLGRMLALAGYPLGIICRCFDETPSCASDVAEVVQASFNDEGAIRKFCSECDVVTSEFENIPAKVLHIAAEMEKLIPGPKAFEIASDRFFEKSLFSQLDIPAPKCMALNSLQEFHVAVSVIGYPSVLKTRRLGYDGKGQRVVKESGEMIKLWRELGSAPLILEEYINFSRELSIIGVQGVSKIRAYPLVENVHRNGILFKTTAPAPNVSPELQAKAEDYLFRIMTQLRYQGVLALELFERDGELYANEIAPRVHNSGHWTIEGADTSQFENHLRAICGLPIGSTAARGKSVLYNLLGTIPEREKLAGVNALHMHLYGKEPKPGRKVGHVTLTGESERRLQTSITKVEQLLAS